MAQADGTILIDTEINADGMKAGSKEVENAVRNMAKSVEDLGTKAKTALNKQVDAFTKLNAEYSAQQKKVDNLKKKVQEYGKQKIPTDEYRDVQNQISQAETRMNSLINAQEKFIQLGGKEDSQRYKSLQYDIDELANTIRYAEGELKDLEDTGKAFTLGGSTKEAAADMRRLEAEMRKLSDMNNRLGTSYSSIKGQVNDYKNDLLKTDKAQKKTSKSGERLNKSLRNTGKAAKSANFGLGKMLGTSILFSFVFRAISGATNAIKDGFTNLAQYSGETNASISMLWSSLERLKNSLATAFAPILNVVAPILSKFIDMLSTAASYVSMFFSFLTGKDTYIRAVAVQKDYAASLKDTATAANEAADALDSYLSPLDDINRYQNPNSSNGIGSIGNVGAGETSPGAMFEEVPIENASKIEEFLQNILELLEPTIDALKRLWNEGLKELRDFSADALIDFYKLFLKPLGKWVLGEGLPALIDAVNDFLKKIDWDKLNKALENFWKALEPFAEAVGTGLIKFFDDLLSFGADVLNFVLPGIFNGLASVLNSIDREDAETIGYVLGAIITAATVKKMAKAISNLTGLGSALGSLKTALKNFRAGTPTKGNITALSLLSWFGADILADTLAEAITGKDFHSATSIVTDTVSGFLSEGFEGGIKNFVNGLGGNIATSVEWMMEMIFGEDSEAAKTARRWAESSNFWEEFAKPWLSKLPEVIKEVGSNGIFGKAIVPLFEGIGNAIEENKDGNLFTTYIWPGLSKLGGNLISGIKEGFTGQFSQMGDAVNGFFNNFSDWFSNGGKMTEKEARSMYGIIGDVITGKWKDTFENSKSIWDAAKNAVIGKWTELKNAAPGTFEGIKNTIGNVWNNVRGTTSNIWETIKNSLSSGWQGIKSNASSIFSRIKTNISEIWTSISSNTSSVWGNISSSVQGIWNNLKGSASNSFSAIKSVISNVWNGIRSITSNIWNGIVKTIKGVVNGIIGGINGMIRGVVSGINSVINALNRFNIKIPSWVPFFGGKTFGFNIRTISAPQIPYLASGAVIPPNREFLAVLGDQNQGNNIEAPEGLLRRIVREETGNGGGNTYEVSAKVGRKELFKIIIDEAKMQRTQTGRNPFELA